MFPGEKTLSATVWAYNGTHVLLPGTVWDLEADEGVEIAWTPAGTTFAARVHDSGFWVATNGSEPGQDELWQVEVDGSAELVATYDEPSTEVTMHDYAVLSGEGSLYQLASRDNRYVVLRRFSSGNVDIPYDTAEDPVVLFHQVSFATGP